MKVILVDAIDTFIIKGKGVYHPMLKLLDKYKYRKIILTNANDEQIIIFGLVNLPYELYTLKHKPDKVNPIYFKKMLKHFNFKPEDVIYFEHNKEAVKSARTIGIKSYYYDPDKKNLKSLKVFLDNNL